jgi:hypothetical protein
MVMKKDGTWRPCGDFRRLNLVTEPDTYPLPNMLDFSARVARCKVFIAKLILEKVIIKYLCIQLTSLAPLPSYCADLLQRVLRYTLYICT